MRLSARSSFSWMATKLRPRSPCLRRSRELPAIQSSILRQVTPKTLRRLIELGTHIILPLAAAQRLSGKLQVAEALRELSAWTEGQVIATDGVNGSWAHTREGIHHQPAFKVDALDTTGCGDAYHGAYASALLDELPLNLRMEFASWIAAQVALSLGGRSNLPTRESLKRENLSVLSSELRRHVES